MYSLVILSTLHVMANYLSQGDCEAAKQFYPNNSGMACLPAELVKDAQRGGGQ